MCRAAPCVRCLTKLHLLCPIPQSQARPFRQSFTELQQAMVGCTVPANLGALWTAQRGVSVRSLQSCTWKTPRVGFEPTTNRLTVDRSTTELPRIAFGLIYYTPNPGRYNGRGQKLAKWRWLLLGNVSRICHFGDSAARAASGRAIACTATIAASESIQIDDSAHLQRYKHTLTAWRSQMFSAIAHELRSPLTSLLVSVELMERNGIEAEKQQARRKRILHSAQHLKRPIGKTGQAERTIPHSRQFHPLPIDLDRVCRVAIAATTEGQSHRLRVQIRNLPRPSVWCVKADGQPIGYILSHVLVYSDDAAPISIDLDCALNPDTDLQGHLILRIRDCGIGIAAEDLEHLYAPFFRGCNVGDRPGMGLGLIITKAAVALHGGSIDMAGELGAETAVSVVAPIAATLASDPPDRERASSPVHPWRTLRPG